VDHVRSGQGPALLRLRVPRLSGHTFIDDQAYKPADVIEEETRRDPLPRLQQHLLAQGWTEAEWDALQADVRQEVQAALEEA
jgi:2-oxoisovalerate dehydrogenase E1 component